MTTKAGAVDAIQAAVMAKLKADAKEFEKRNKAKPTEEWLFKMAMREFSQQRLADAFVQDALAEM